MFSNLSFTSSPRPTKMNFYLSYVRLEYFSKPQKGSCSKQTSKRKPTQNKTRQFNTGIYYGIITIYRVMYSMVVGILVGIRVRFHGRFESVDSGPEAARMPPVNPNLQAEGGRF